MERCIFWIKFITIILYVVIGIGMLFPFLKLYYYLKMQLLDYWESRHLDKVLAKKSVTAMDYLDYMHAFNSFFPKSPTKIKGFGSRALCKKLVRRARQEIAICNFENDKELSTYCSNCYYCPVCKQKYRLTCRFCKDTSCRSCSTDLVCDYFICRDKRVVADNGET